tara:strand:- start:747 stop:1121 length:375 start_codon:yes stop_codon:yes gene_type:complete
MKRLLLAPLFLIISSCDYLPMTNYSEDYTKTLRYSDFIDAVKEKKISRVLIDPDNATTKVIGEDGLRYEVNLAPDKNLLKILTENNVDIAVIPTTLGEGLETSSNGSRIKKDNAFKDFLNYFFK